MNFSRSTQLQNTLTDTKFKITHGYSFAGLQYKNKSQACTFNQGTPICLPIYSHDKTFEAFPTGQWEGVVTRLCTTCTSY